MDINHLGLSGTSTHIKGTKTIHGTNETNWRVAQYLIKYASIPRSTIPKEKGMAIAIPIYVVNVFPVYSIARIKGGPKHPAQPIPDVQNTYVNHY